MKPAAGIELVDRVDEPEDPVAHEVGLLDVLRQTGGDPTGDELHERRVVEDQPLARVRGAAVLVVAPEPGDDLGGVGLGGDGGGVVRHGDGLPRRPPGGGRG